MESYVVGEVVIYEGHLKDELVQISDIKADKWYLINKLNGPFIRDTTIDRLRKASREALTNEILRLESSLTTLRGAMRDFKGAIQS